MLERLTLNGLLMQMHSLGLSAVNRDRPFLEEDRVEALNNIMAIEHLLEDIKKKINETR